MATRLGARPITAPGWTGRARTDLALIDCDVHQSIKRSEDLFPYLPRVYREQVVEPRQAELAPVIKRGIARGDLRPDTDVRLIHELLVGPIFYRLLFSGAALDRNLGRRIVDAILAGFAPRVDD